MSKPSTKRWTTERKKTAAVVAVAGVLTAVNIVPLHYSKQLNCPDGGTYTVRGITMGLPLAYYETSQGSGGDCMDYVGSSNRGFSTQLLLGDALVFGLVMVGLNMLLDRRTKA